MIDDGRELCVYGEKGCKHYVVSHNALINGYCKNQKVDQAMRLYREMLHEGTRPTIIICNIYPGGSFQAGKV